ncbi:MAG TPA: CHAT domain-containing tetratricopeptide repeat protein [Stellaceae bacterium]|nr:CHAT domain-containing tetratricopeptide repeat protein [Stellaceae bacterium]
MRPAALAALVLGLIALAAPGQAEEDELARLLAQSDRLYNTGQYADAVPVTERIVALTRERYGEADPRYAAALNGLATFLQFTGALDRAEKLLRQSLAIDLAALGPDHPDVATRRGNLALVLLDEDNPVEAAGLLHQALVAVEQQKTPPENQGATLSNFAAALERLNRPKEAERLYRAAIAALEPQQGEGRARLAIALGNLGILYKSEHRLDEAQPLLEQAVAILEALSTPDHPHPRLATALNNLGTLREDKQDFAGAELLYQRALDLDRAMFGPDSPRLATRLANLGGMYVTENRLDDADKALKAAMRIDRAAYGDDHPKVAQLCLAFARLFTAQKQWEAAHALISRAADIMIAADRRRSVTSGRIAAGRDIPDVSLSQIVYATFLQVSGEWPWSDTSQFAKLGGPAFDVAQRLVAPAAAAAILRMARRYAAGDPALADKVRQQEDLTDRWNIAETRIIGQLALPAPQIDHAAVTAQREAQTRIEQQLKSLDAQVETNAQGYAALSGARVLTIARVQQLLADDEALVYFADDGVHIHAFFITREKAAWSPLAYTSATIAGDVQALRCGLDGTAWLDARADRCQQLLQINYTDDDFRRNEELPFDLGRAHQLYEALFGTLGSLIASKRLIVVPTGALATLPFQVLVTEAPDQALTGDERYRKAAWLVKRQAVTVLPSVASLEALRSVVPKNRAKEPFIGIGNPLLDGPQDGIPDAERRQIEATAALARSEAACPAVAPVLRQQMAALTAPAIARGGMPGDASVLDLPALPETADELCAIAKDLGVGDDDVLLGARATKRAVLELSESGRLDAFAVVHFATHGLVSGELQGLAEPALALTPADPADPNDNGLLTASDVAGLRLDADWVVLSSCNTAAGSADDNEAFSGLARAFFFAGARALMVSHWQVYSEAAVELTTGAYKALRAEPAIGRAEALRRSMLAVLAQGGVKSRPAHWAPFVVVGDGG